MTDAAFRREFGDQFFDRYWQLKPDWALAIGYYQLRRSTHRAGCDVTRDGARADRALARGAAQYRSRDAEPGRPRRLGDARERFLGERWWLTELRAWQWNPSLYNVAEPFALLLTSTYAPLEERLRTFLARLANVPAYYAAAKGQHRSPDASSTRSSPSSRTAAHSTCSAQRSRTRSARSGLAPAERTAFADASPGRASRDRGLRRLARSAGSAARERRRHGALVPSRPRALRRRSSRSTTNRAIPPSALYARALAEKDLLLERMEGLADQLWPKYFPGDAGTERHAREDRPRHRAAGRRPCAAGAAAAGDRTADPRARALGARAQLARARPDQTA